MTTYVVSIEGQTIQLPPGIGEKDDDVKRAMAPYFPEVTNALLNRKADGDTVTITVVKKAGSKGLAGDAIQHLSDCPGGKNPAIALCEEISQMEPQSDLCRLLELEQNIDKAISDGEEQNRGVMKAHERLINAQAQPAQAGMVVEGF